MRFLKHRDLAVATLSGVLLAAAFPSPDLSFLAWFALVPLLYVMPQRPYACGYAAGIGFFMVALYWVNIVMVTYGRLHPLLSVIAYLALCAYLALFFAVAIWLTERLCTRLQLSLSLVFPVVWVATELLRSVLMTGFPWVLLGYSQHNMLALIQSADLFGVYGISALLALSNAVLLQSLPALRRWDRRLIPQAALAFFALLLIADLGYGVYTSLREPDPAPTLKVGLVQGNIDQSIKWDPANQASTVATYLDLSRDALQEGAELLVWPESATPFYFQEESPLSRQVRESVVESGRYLVLGSPAYERYPGAVRYLNSAYLLSRNGILGRSDKVHLVPFGEYVPLGRFLPFIDKLVVGIGDFSPGVVTALPLNGESVSVLICYEGIFPELARAAVAAGSNLLINVTNDAWFGQSSAPYQHLAMTRFRAIENRRWLVRAANTGVSAIIAPNGEIVAQSPLFKKAVVSGEVALRAEKTIYTRFGDLIPLLFLCIVMVWFFRSRRQRLK